MKNIRFKMSYVFYEKNVSDEDKRLGAMYPQKAMKELGITYKKAIPQSMGDQWWFYDCENVPEKLPPFLTLMGDIKELWL